MNRGHAAIFIAGFFFGCVALLVGISVAPSGWPRPAGAAPTPAVPESPAATRVPSVTAAAVPAPTTNPAAAQSLPTAEQIAKAVLREIEKMTTGGRDAKENCLQSDLQTIRSQMELYKVQHLDKYPGFDAKGQFDGVLFAAQITCQTDEKGSVFSGQGDKAAYSYGPYMTKIPANPYLPGPVASRVVGGPGSPPRDGAAGWWVDTKSGRFSDNHPLRAGS